MRTLRLRDEAVADLDEAAQWYESQQPGLGGAFLDGVTEAFQRLIDRPLAYPVIYRKTRRALLRRFPFAIFYSIEGSTILIVAILHGSRHPRRWRQR
jgi:plasmid stabilization system protein ParE